MDLPERALNYVKGIGFLNPFDSEGQKMARDFSSDEFIKNSPPNYVNALIEGTLRNDSGVFSDERLMRIVAVRQLFTFDVTFNSERDPQEMG